MLLAGKMRPLGGLALTVTVATGSAVLAVTPDSASAHAYSYSRHGRILTYLGRDFDVPTSWRVVDLTTHPSACVRFDVHAVYLGRPGGEQRCPADGVGRRTGALLIEPDLTRSGDTAAIVASDHRLAGEIDVTGPGITVTASYDGDADDRATVVDALTAAGLPPPPPPAEPDLTDLTAVPGPFHSSAPVQVMQGTNVVAGLGFDTCTAPSATQMQAWAASPFNTVGIYIGGSERACGQTNLTRDWVAARARTGWHFMPLYVGWQAAWDSLTANPPAVLGRRSADDAAVQAANLGFGAGSVLYYDMESYKTTAQSKAAIAFLSAWNTELHAKGYRSAVYSSASTGIADLVANRGRMTEPDVVDIAHWNGVADADPKATPANAWPNQRAHQYIGNATGSYGGVTMSIDKDYMSIDIPVCTAPLPTPTTHPTPSPTSPLFPSTAPSPSTTSRLPVVSSVPPSTVPRSADPRSNRLGAC